METRDVNVVEKLKCVCMFMDHSKIMFIDCRIIFSADGGSLPRGSVTHIAQLYIEGKKRVEGATQIES